MLKQILRTALVTAGVACIMPFAGAQGFRYIGRPLVMGNLGGNAVMPGVFSVINPSAGFIRSAGFISAPTAGVMRSVRPNFGFVQPAPANGSIIMMGSVAGTPAVTAQPSAARMAAATSGVSPLAAGVMNPGMATGSTHFGFVQPAPLDGSKIMMGSPPRATNPAPTPGFRQAFSVGRAR